MPFNDAFNGTAGEKLHTRSGWTKFGTGSDASAPEVNGSNQLRVHTSTSDVALIGQDIGAADHYAQATVYTGFSFNGTGSRSLICVRSVDRNSYWGVSHNSAEGLWELMNPLGRQRSYAAAIANGDVVRIEAEGNAIRGYINGVLRLEVASSTYLNTNTRVGFIGRGTPGSDPVIDDWESSQIGGDITAPTLTGASASATSGTTSSGSVTTNEANGTLYWLTNTSSTATGTAVKAASSQAVTATGVQNTSSTGLSAGTTYYTHFLHRDAAGNDSAVLSSGGFTTPAPDTTAPTFTGSITVGAKTSSTIALALPTATDNVAVTGYQYRINGGAWEDNGNSTAVALSGLTALTSYTIDARAYDAIPNHSATLSVTTSTYRAGASAGSIVTATAPQDGNPAGFLYALAGTLPVSDWVSYTITSGPTPSGGTLDAQPNGAFSYTGPAPATMVVQPEVNGTPTAETITVTLYDQVADLTASGGTMVLAMSSAAVQAVESLSASAMSIGLSVNGFAVSDVPTLEAGSLLFAVDLSTGAVSGINDAWPARGVRAIVSPGGLDHEPVKVFEQYSFDREVYEADFDAKYLAQVSDAAATLQAFTLPASLPGASRVAVGGALSSGVVMFSIGPNAPVGVHEVLLQIATAGGRTKGCIVQIKVDR